MGKSKLSHIKKWVCNLYSVLLNYFRLFCAFMCTKVMSLNNSLFRKKTRCCVGMSMRIFTTPRCSLLILIERGEGRLMRLSTIIPTAIDTV